MTRCFAPRRAIVPQRVFTGNASDLHKGRRGAACCAPTRPLLSRFAFEWRFVAVAVHDQVNVNDYERHFMSAGRQEPSVVRHLVDGNVIVDVVFDGDGDVNESHV